MSDVRIVGIDPGRHTGVALFVGGVLVGLYETTTVSLGGLLRALNPDGIVFEDSRLQSRVWAAHGQSRFAALKIARNVGEIDLQCRLIEEIAATMGVPSYGVSPLKKGAKLNAATFKKVTGWVGRSNEHKRDAAMVAWPYRTIANPRK